MIKIGKKKLNKKSYESKKKIIEKGGIDLYVMKIMKGGNMIGELDGKDVEEKKGDIVIIDMEKKIVRRELKG